jgi:cell division protein FtsQ
LGELKTLAKQKAEARERKLRQIRRKKRVRNLLIIAGVLVAISFVYYLYNASFLNIKKIEVKGNRNLSDQQITEVAGARLGENLLRASTGRMRARLLKNPWIKLVSVNRRLPNKLEIIVTERKPFAIISFKGQFYLVDEDSFIIAKKSSLDSINLPSITDLPVARIKVGEILKIRALENAIACLKSLPVDLRKSIYLLSASSVEKLSLYSRDEVEIIYGPVENAEKKNQVLKAILNQQKDNGRIIFVDVRAYKNPIVKRLESIP